MNTPKMYGKGYKLFETPDGKTLYPLFIGKNKATAMNEWISAENIPTNGYSARPGWHCSDSIPDAPWLRGYDGSELGPYRSRFKNGKRVWCEVLYDMTNDYREEALKQPKKYFTDKIPEDGFYMFNESNRGTWVITSSLMVTKILSDAEVKDILDAQGYDMVAAYAPYKAAFEKRMETLAS